MAETFHLKTVTGVGSLPVALCGPYPYGPGPHSFTDESSKITCVYCQAALLKIERENKEAAARAQDSIARAQEMIARKTESFTMSMLLGPWPKTNDNFASKVNECFRGCPHCGVVVTGKDVALCETLLKEHCMQQHGRELSPGAMQRGFGAPSLVTPVDPKTGMFSVQPPPSKFVPHFPCRICQRTFTTEQGRYTHEELHVGVADPVKLDAKGREELLAEERKRANKQFALASYRNGMSVPWIAETLKIMRDEVAKWVRESESKDRFSRVHTDPELVANAELGTLDVKKHEAAVAKFLEEQCPECNGHGKTPSLKSADCVWCHGTGKQPLWNGKPIRSLADDHLTNTLAMLERNARARLKKSKVDENQWRERVPAIYEDLEREAARRDALLKKPTPPPVKHLEFVEVGDAALGVAHKKVVRHLEHCVDCKNRVKDAIAELAEIRRRATQKEEIPVDEIPHAKPVRLTRAQKVAMFAVFVASAVAYGLLGTDLLEHAQRLYLAWLARLSK